MTAPLGLYVHWPFCARICPYCDFNVYLNRGADADAWSKALTNDIERWADRIERQPLTSIYFGGGTPALAPVSVVEDVVETAQRLFGLGGEPEITLEANPNDADEARFDALAKAGVNRLSLGVQSFDDRALRFLGRDHDAETARRAIDAGQAAFSMSTFDLIYGRPEQSLDDWRAELSEALSYDPEHLSLYQLTIEPGTAFASAVNAGRWAPADDDVQRRQYELAQDMTAAHGLEAYEISNHARPGAESRHNLIYWRYHDYIGVGPGAHGRLTIDGKRIATKAPDRPEAYLAGAEGETEALDEEAQLIERLSMGLRLKEGVALYADDYFYANEQRVFSLQRLLDEGFLRHDCGALRATTKGRAVLNRVLYELLG